MHFLPRQVYHIYNRGEQKRLIFSHPHHYFYFIRKVQVEWSPYCNILAYCLMPRYFHFLLITNTLACMPVKCGVRNRSCQRFSRIIANTIGSYTQSVNLENHRHGQLLINSTRAVIVPRTAHAAGCDDPAALLTCFHFIHYNPVAAGLSRLPTDWENSSARDYAGMREGTLCNQPLFYSLAGLEPCDVKVDKPVMRPVAIQGLFK